MLTIVILCVAAALALSMSVNGSYSTDAALALILCTMAASALVLGDLGRIIRPLINKKRLEVLDEGVRAGSKKMLFLAALFQGIRDSHPILLLIPVYTYVAYVIKAFDTSILFFGALAVIEFVLSTAIGIVAAYVGLRRKWLLYLM